MSLVTLAIIIVVAIIVLFVIFRIAIACLPKIILGIIIIGGLGYLAYYFLTR